ncbi:MAG TPA: hypothetical protein VKS22_16170 [Candidatus Binataceae bacterium]|nr:hypothetical protein [Candidatus Binataceae bacterium]
MPNVDDHLEPDQLLSSQWADLYRRRHHGMEGERRLVLEVFADALTVLRVHRRATRSKWMVLYRDTLAWVMSAATQPFSVEWCCQMLESDGLRFDAEAIRRAVRAREIGVIARRAVSVPRVALVQPRSREAAAVGMMTGADCRMRLLYLNWLVAAFWLSLRREGFLIGMKSCGGTRDVTKYGADNRGCAKR